MKALVLAAGKGVRLEPLTTTRPKHLIDVCGRPILEHSFRALKSAGISEVLVVTHYMSGAIRERFGDGKGLGLKIEYAEQKSLLGTGDAARFAESYVKEDFLLVYGDLLFEADAIRRVLEAFAEEKPSVAVAVVQVKNPESYGIVELENDKQIKRIVEKPKHEDAPSNLANAGIYVFSLEILQKLKEISASSRGEYEIPDAISALLKEGKRVVAVKIPSGGWLDIGRPWDLLEANRWVLDNMIHKVMGTVENGAYLMGPVTLAESARVRSGAYVEGPAFIGENSDIGPNCYIRPFTSIGRKVRIGNACEIKNSLVMDGVHIGHLTYVGDSIIGEKCNLGAGSITANYRLDESTIKMMVRDQLVDSGRKKLGAILGDNVKSGINALFMPGVKVGANSLVGPSVVVGRDLPANTSAMLNQTIERRDLARDA